MNTTNTQRLLKIKVYAREVVPVGFGHLFSCELNLRTMKGRFFRNKTPIGSLKFDHRRERFSGFLYLVGDKGRDEHELNAIIFDTLEKEIRNELSCMFFGYCASGAQRAEWLKGQAEHEKEALITGVKAHAATPYWKQGDFASAAKRAGQKPALQLVNSPNDAA